MQYHNRLAFNSDGEAMFYCFNTCREFIRTIPALMYDCLLYTSVAEMKDNDVKGGRRVVWSPQERQAEFMQRGEYEALYGLSLIHI